MGHKYGSESFKNLKKIKKLYMTHINSFVDLKEMPFLEDIMLFNSNISAEDCKYLCNIKKVNLQCCNIYDEHLKYLGDVENLTIRYASNITNEGLKHLNKTKFLYFVCSRIDNNGIKYLENVQVLKLPLNKYVTINAIKDMDKIIEFKIPKHHYKKI